MYYYGIIKGKKIVPHVGCVPELFRVASIPLSNESRKRCTTGVTAAHLLIMKGRKYVLHMKTPNILASEETKTRVSDLKHLRKRDLSCTHSPCPHSVRFVAKWRYQGSRYFGPLKKSWGII